ncbi:MAG: flagellar basal body-associated FliL family protein [Anaerolineae bacterium]|nr:flagellar basal body-associated FliL family protein [Anaerolineae bacterium]
MSKILPILSIVSKVATTLFTTVIGVIALFTAYIIFAPDEFPKPFRIMYANPGEPLLGYTEGEAAAHGEGEAVEATPEPLLPGQGKMINMSTKIINLADPTGRKYIRLTVVLEFEPPHVEETTEKPAASGGYGGGEAAAADPSAEFEAKINALMPLFDDTVITLLSTKTFEDLYTAEGKEKLRQELMDAIGDRVPDYHLISIYFTEFVVQ